MPSKLLRIISEKTIFIIMNSSYYQAKFGQLGLILLLLLFLFLFKFQLLSQSSHWSLMDMGFVDVRGLPVAGARGEAHQDIRAIRTQCDGCSCCVRGSLPYAYVAIRTWIAVRGLTWACREVACRMENGITRRTSGKLCKNYEIQG